MVRRDHLGHAEGRQPHQAGAAAPPRDVVDELDRRAVAPVQVFRHQQQRPLLGVAVEQLAHLAQHAVRAHAGQFAPQCVAFLRGAEPRQLQQPGRRHACAAARAGPRPCGTARPAPPAPADRARRCRSAPRTGRARTATAPEARHEVLDQRGLADARLAGHPHHRPLPAAGLAPGAAQPGDRVGTTDERRRLARAGERADGGARAVARSQRPCAAMKR